MRFNDVLMVFLGGCEEGHIFRVGWRRKTVMAACLYMWGGETPCTAASALHATTRQGLQDHRIQYRFTSAESRRWGRGRAGRGMLEGLSFLHKFASHDSLARSLFIFSRVSLVPLRLLPVSLSCFFSLFCLSVQVRLSYQSGSVSCLTLLFLFPYSLPCSLLISCFSLFLFSSSPFCLFLVSFPMHIYFLPSSLT